MQVYKVGLKVRAALITEVYRKSLSISLTTLSQYSTGQVRPSSTYAIMYDAEHFLLGVAGGQLHEH